MTILDRLAVGFSHNHAGLAVTYRLFRATDDVDAITALLHRAYAPLAAAGLRYFASHQSPEVTRQRLGRGDAVVAIADGVVVGTVTLSRIEETRGCAFYDRPDVASFGQFAVEPALQGRGVGSMLLDVVDALAMERGVGQLALDTAAPATDLIAYYTARGFAVVDHLQWEAVNYPSVVLARPPRMPQHLR